MPPDKTIPETSIRVEFSLVGKPHQLSPDLTEQEITALGYVTCQWAFLEHAVLIDTIVRARRLKVAIPANAKSKSFSRRLRAWHDLIQKSKKIRPAEKERLSRLGSTIANLEQKRHQITQGLWSWEPKTPHRLIAYSFRPEVDFQEPFDSDKIWDLGDKIGQVNFQLVYPGGEDHAYKELLSRGAGMSRSLLLRAHGGGRSESSG